MTFSKMVRLSKGITIGDIRIKKFNHLGSVVKDYGKWYWEIQKCIGIAKNNFKMLKESIKRQKSSLETKKTVLKYILR